MAQAALNGWWTPPEEIRHVEHTHEAEIVVLGLGYAGVSALRAAAEGGLKAVGIELKQEQRYSTLGHNIGHINSAFLRSRGVPEVDELEYFNEWMRRAGGRANPSLVMKYVKNCGTAFDWFMDNAPELRDMSVAFWPGGNRFDGSMSGYRFWVGTVNSLLPEEGPRMTLVDGDGGETATPPKGPEHDFSAIALRNIRKAEKQGAEAFFGYNALYLTKQDGRVTGAVCRETATGEYHLFKGSRGVILATGDFSGNAEMMHELVHDLRDLYREGDGSACRGMGRNGAGHRMGLWAGGVLEAGSIPVMGGNFNVLRGLNRSFGILWLDAQGKRFCNETFGDPQILGFMNNQMPRRRFYNIFDSAIEEDLQSAVPAHEGYDCSRPTDWSTILPTAVAAGKGGCLVRAGSETIRLIAGNSMEELMDNAGFEGPLRANFAESIERYNMLCRNGRDEDFGKDAKLLRPLDRWPLFIQVQSYRSRVLCTVGGLVTNEDQQCLDRNYEPIAGLYATGNTCGRRFGAQYAPPMAGASISKAITLGRELGKTIAQSKP